MDNSRIDRWLLSTLRKALAPARVQVALGPGDEPRPEAVDALPRIRIHDRSTLVSLLLKPQMAFGDPYSQGQLEIERNLARGPEGLYRSPASSPTLLASKRGSWAHG